VNIKCYISQDFVIGQFKIDSGRSDPIRTTAGPYGNFFLSSRPNHDEHGPKVPVTPELVPRNIVSQRVIVCKNGNVS
jgi:hypothetical protein